MEEISVQKTAEAQKSNENVSQWKLKFRFCFVSWQFFFTAWVYVFKLSNTCDSYQTEVIRGLFWQKQTTGCDVQQRVHSAPEYELKQTLCTAHFFFFFFLVNARQLQGARGNIGNHTVK